jgi:hypothetical protein
VPGSSGRCGTTASWRSVHRRAQNCHAITAKAPRLFQLPGFSKQLISHLHSITKVTCLLTVPTQLLLLLLLLLQLRSPSLALTVPPTTPAATPAAPIKRSHTCATLQHTS